MGYTHYWAQTRNFTNEEWFDVVTDFNEILKYVQHTIGIPLANGMGDAGSAPVFDIDHITFNGVGEESHETFNINRKRRKEWEGGIIEHDFCKTARKGYDLAVTACLCYVSSVTQNYHVSSDGHGKNFVDGLDAARKALPNKANMLDIPMGVMEDDRWTGPWVSHQGKDFHVYFCINGKGYIHCAKTDEWYCFHTHQELGVFLDAHKEAKFKYGGGNEFGRYDAIETNIWNAYGAFDKIRLGRLALRQAFVLAELFPAPADHAQRPPAYVRPMDYIRPEDNNTFCYSLDDLLKKHAA